MTDAYLQARTLAGVRRWGDAERALRRGLSHRPGDADLLTLLSYLLRMQRDLPAALAAADAATSAGPARFDAHLERAESLLALVRTDDAAAAAAEAVRLDPGRAAGHLALARALAAGRRFDAARSAARHALTLAPGSVPALLTAAGVERDAGDPEAAAGYAQAALTVDPAGTEGRWLLAVLDGERLRVRRSMRGLRDVARDDPARPDLLAMLWPVRGLLAGLRRWLPVAVLVVALCGPAARWWPAVRGPGRLLALFFAAAVLVVAARVLVPAGPLPWRCLRLLPPRRRGVTLAGLVTAAAILALLLGYAATGRWWLPVAALACAPVLWASADRPPA